MDHTIYRYEVPVDDMSHVLRITGAPVHIASRIHGVVEFWAEFNSDIEPRETRYIVIGTGHRIPEGAKYVGTTLASHGLVWHLYELQNIPAALKELR